MRGKDLRMECRKLINKKKNLTLLNDLVNKLQYIIKKSEESQNVKKISVNLESLNVKLPKDVNGNVIKLSEYVVFISRKLKLNVSVKNEEKHIITMDLTKEYINLSVIGTFLVACFAIIIFCGVSYCFAHFMYINCIISAFAAVMMLFLIIPLGAYIYRAYRKLRNLHYEKLFFGEVK